MAEKPQDMASPKIPDHEVANFRKNLLAIFADEPPLAERYEKMIELVGAGVSPDTAAPACGVFHEWEELGWFRDAIDAAWARFKARVLINVGNHLVGKTDAPNASLAGLFMKAHCGFNEKSAEGWHQTIKILPVVSASAGIGHSPDRNYADIYAERQRQAESEAASARELGQNAFDGAEDEQSGP